MGTEVINESIQVGAVFGRDRRLIKPVWFIWNRKKYLIKAITYTWEAREGKTKLYNFAVTDGKTLYNISYNQDRMTWRLSGIDMGE